MAISYNPRIVTDGLVLALDAGNPKSYPGSGTTWTDLSGNGNNGTLVNGVGYNSGNGGSLSFDGVDDYINFSSFTNPYSETVIVWVKSATELWDDTGWISSSRAQNGHIIHPNGGTKSITFYVIPETVSYRPILSITPDNIMIPHMYCYTTNGSNLHQVYFDGSFMGQSTTNITRTLTPSPQRYDVGFDNAGGGRYGNGNIYSCLRYNKALSASEIQQNFNATRSRFSI
jgi:hypothetical protein